MAARVCDERGIRETLAGRRPSWDLLLEMQASAAVAAQVMRCSGRTALRSLKAAAERAERRALESELARQAALEAIGLSGERSNWPLSLQQMAEAIEREGEDAVSASERNAALRGMPRSVGVAR